MGKEFIVKYPVWFKVFVIASWLCFLGFTIFVTINLFVRGGFTALRMIEVVFFYLILTSGFFPFYFFLYHLSVTESGIDVIFKNGAKIHQNWQDIISIERLKLSKRVLIIRKIKCRDGKNILVARDMAHYRDLLECIKQHVNIDIPIEAE